MATEKEMQRAFHRYFFKKYAFMGINIRFSWPSSEFDIFGVRENDYADEIEIKSTAGGFKRDFTKTLKSGTELKHDKIRAGETMCNYFSFLLPEELVDKCEIPEYAGLYVYTINEAGYGVVTEEKTAPILHGRKLKEEDKLKVAVIMTEKFWQHKGVLIS